MALCVIAGETLGEVDVVYMKNVVLKFITAQAAGKTTVRPPLAPPFKLLRHEDASAVAMASSAKQ